MEPHGGNLMEEGTRDPERGVEENRGPHLTSVVLIQRSERCTAYRFPPAPRAGTPPQFTPSAASSPSALACGPRSKSAAAPPAHIAPRLCSRLHRVAPPRGNLMEEGMGGPGRGTRGYGMTTSLAGSHNCRSTTGSAQEY